MTIAKLSKFAVINFIFLLSSILFSFWFSSFALERKIDSQHVIIRSSFQEEGERPPLKDHQYDLQSVDISHLSYTPLLDISPHTLPDNFADNENLHWLTTISGGIAKLFLGAQGIFEDGVALYRQGEFEKAKERFKRVHELSAIYRERSSLWLSWVDFKLGLYHESLKTATTLLKVKNVFIRIEALYISSLIYRSQEGYRYILPSLIPIFESIPRERWDSRLNYLYLSSLIHQKKWSTAQTFLGQFNRTDQYYTESFHKIIELEGLVAFATKHYTQAIKSYSLVKKLDADQTNQFLYDRALAWSNFYIGQFGKVQKILRHKRADYWREYNGEIKYLNLFNLLRQKKWNQVEKQYRQLSPQSKFYSQASFLLLSRLTQGKGHENLRKALVKVKYNQPDMKFYAALLSGNQKFKERKFKEAERFYLNAVIIKLKNTVVKPAYYNLALTYLKENKLKEAKGVLDKLTGKPKRWRPYHLLYINYQLKQDSEFISRYKKLNLPAWPAKHQLDMLFMYAGIHLSKGENSVATTEFMKLWKKTKRVENLEYVAKALYRQRYYNRVIKLTNNRKLLKSDTLFSYRIRSLLGLRQFHKAEKEIKSRQLLGDKLIQLRLEVWMANKRYKTIIRSIPVLLQQVLNRKKRIFYYLSLGDAYFNLQQYSKSKNQFYKALAIADTPEKKSVIHFNIIQATFFSGNKEEFSRENLSVLQKGYLSANIRYNLTILQADYYAAEGTSAKADQLLDTYIQHYPYKKGMIFLKRIKLLHGSKQFRQCFSLSRESIAEESVFQRRDRIIVNAKCSRSKWERRHVVHVISKELEQKDSYRMNELGFVLAKMHFNLEQYHKSIARLEQLDLNKASAPIKAQVTLLLSRNYLSLKQTKKAETILANASFFRGSAYYPEVLLLAAEIKIAQNDVESALRSMLRAYYLKNVSARKKQELLLKMSNLSLDEQKKEQSLKYFKLIKFEKLKDDQELLKEYQILKTELSPLL